MTEIIIWTVAIAVFLIVEAMTASLTSIWFALGSLAALVAALFDGGIFSQLVVFLIVSIASVILIKRVYTKKRENNQISTNSDRLIGKSLVIASVDEKSKEGIVLVNDVSWKVKTETQEPLKVGDRVTVLKIEGVKLIVEKSFIGNIK